MAHAKRLLSAIALSFAVFLPALCAADRAKPKVRAVTGFITIDAKSYPSQFEEAAKFLSQVRETIQAAGYEVQGIRITTQPFPDYTRGLSRAEALKLLRGISELAGKQHFSVSVGPAMSKDNDSTDPVEILTDALSTAGNRVNGTIVTAGEDGIHWNAIRQAAHLIKTVGERSPHGQGNSSFAAAAMIKAYVPFYPGSWHPAGSPRSFSIGLESANVVMEVFSREHDPRTAAAALTRALTLHARAVEAASMKAAAGSGWTYAGIDPTPAPRGPVSIGAAIESFTGAPFGSPGTETASGIITRAVKAVPVKQAGYSGLMLAVLEDDTLLRRWTEGTYGIDSILAYSAVCATGVDTVPLAGDTSEDAIARIIGDVATLAFKWNKPLATRLLPAPGKKAGDMTEFSGIYENTIIQPLSGSPRR
ncbi:MAG TPA: DUF711 family protein [Bryobacteraceae bacterium]|jgi:uncharacterized protein (UPF0210 family)|nr:DUF711 family protein [Bryobacteraceae bacterium]